MNNNKISIKSRAGYLSIASTLLLVGSTFMSQVANAVPAFARQTDVQCTGCHFQSFPALNAFGRNFRANGYTLVGSEPLIEGDDISLPSRLNTSIITKVRYQVKGDTDGNRGEIQWPDEAALLVGGRFGESAGFLMEIGLGPQEAEVGPGTLTCTNNADASTCVVDGNTGDVTGNYLSTKFHFNITDSFAVVPFSTDGLGVGYGFEMLNTGLQRSQRPIENRKGFSAAQILGTASGGATGIAFVYHADDLFVNYSHWSPTWGNVNANVIGGLAHYIRAAYMPNIGGWDVGVGFSLMTGSVEVNAQDPADEVMVDNWGIDAQAQGTMGNMPLGVYLSYGVAPQSDGVSGADTNVYNGSLTDDATALGLLAKLSVVPGKTDVYLGYGSHDAGVVDTSEITIGVQHMVDQNIKLELYNVSSDTDNDGDDYTMLMFFAGF